MRKGRSFMAVISYFLFFFYYCILRTYLLLWGKYCVSIEVMNLLGIRNFPHLTVSSLCNVKKNTSWEKRIIAYYSLTHHLLLYGQHPSFVMIFVHYGKPIITDVLEFANWNQINVFVTNPRNLKKKSRKYMNEKCTLFVSVCISSLSILLGNENSWCSKTKLLQTTVNKVWIG